MKKIFLLVPLMLLIMGALNTSSSTWQFPINVDNIGTSTVTDVIDVANISTEEYIQSGLISTDPSTLYNFHVAEAGSSSSFMPGTKATRLEYALLEEPSASSTYTDQTSASYNSTASDVSLTPTGSSSTYYFGLHNRAKHLILNIDQALIASGLVTVAWNYLKYDPVTPTWESLTVTSDGTAAVGSDCYLTPPAVCSSFTASGLRKITFEIPSNNEWIDTVHPEAIAAGISPTEKSYWIQAVVPSGTFSQTATATTVNYDTGLLYFYINSLDPVTDGLLQNIAGGTDSYTENSIPIDHYKYFPGALGIETGDASDLELDGEWAFESKTKVGLDDFTKYDEAYILNKPNAYIMKFISGKDKTGAVSGDQNTIEWSNPSATYFSGVWTHNEDIDSTSYYSGAGQESYSKGFKNSASNWRTVHDENSADTVLSTDNKVGMILDNTIVTTPAFGAKINDPS